MTLRVRDVRDLEKQVLQAARGIELTEEMLGSATEWFDRLGLPEHLLDRQTFAALCEYARSGTEPTARALAIGVLRWLPGTARDAPDLARFATCFVLRRIASLSNQPMQWSGVSIPSTDVARATEIFEEALGGSGHSDEELLSSAEKFIAQHESSSDLFGRFAQDLSALTEALKNTAAAPEHRDVARAALDYFALESDAISDHLGLVGLLDDAFVVRRAVERIRPGRAALAAVLDRVVADWAFLRDMTLGDGADEYALSEFMVINLALVSPLLEADGDRRGRVLVTPEAGPLAMLIGWIRGLAAVRDIAVHEALPVLEKGERLAHRETGAELVFEGYGHLSPKGAFLECEPGDASHFRARHRGKGKGGDVFRNNPIADLKSLQRSARDAERLKGGKVSLDVAAAPLGPLERMFGVLSPISMPDRHGRVIVVAPIGESRALAERLTLYGVPLADVIPVEQAWSEEDTPLKAVWGNGAGGEALVTVVRSAAEALELTEIGGRETVGVVAAVRPRSTDPTHLARIAGNGIPVMAIVEERDQEALETFEAQDFAFWNWDDDWLSQLHWNPIAETHVVSAYEKDFRRRASSRVEVVPVELPGLQDANAQLRNLDQIARREEHTLLDEVVRAGFNVLVGLCRCHGSVDGLRRELEGLAVRVEAQSRWWTDEIIGCVRGAIAALRESVQAAAERNPKNDFVRDWSRAHPTGAILARSRSIEEAAKSPDRAGVPWMDARRRGSIDGPVLIPAWLGGSTMSQLLVPPIAESLTLALYAPEREWHGSLVRTRRRAQVQLSKLVRKRSAVPIASSTLPEPPELPPPEPTVDDIIDRVRRAAALGKLGVVGGEGAEPVEARLAYFTDGYWAPFTPDHRVNSVTHLLAATGDGAADEALREVPASELRAGDKIIVVRGSDHDALRHAADAILPPGIRQMAAEWQGAIRRFLASHRISELQRRLESHGCARTSQTIRIWEREDRIIGPMSVGDVRAIQRATEDRLLAEREVECMEAIALIRSTHLRVAHDLAERVLATAQARLGDVGGGEGAVELDDRLLLLTVESIDAELVPVPRHAANRLRESEDAE